MDGQLLGEPGLQLVQRVMKRLLAAALGGVCLAGNAWAVPPARPVVVELFTSQACSDCPPADALLRRLQAADPGLLVLDLHVTYFNGPGWTDPFSSKMATDRQYWYASLRHADQVFTPQAVVDGKAVVVGSRRTALLQAIMLARAATAQPLAQLAIAPERDGWRIAVSGEGPLSPAMITYFRFDAIDHTAVRGGENSGADLTEIHVVRAIASLGQWTGEPVARHVGPGPGSHIAVLVQQDDGTILAAASQ